MEDSARRRGRRPLWPVLFLGFACVGCAGVACFDASTSDPLALADAAVLPAGLDTRRLAAARESQVAGPKKGIGFSIAYLNTIFSGWQTKATDAIPTTAATPSYGQYMYRDLFDDAQLGISGSWIITRPGGRTLAIGDTYLLGRVDVQSFPGRIWDGTNGPTEFDRLTQLSFWLEAKTMFSPVGRVLRPYARYAAGIVQIGKVKAELAPPASESTGFYDSTLTGGLSGGFGVDIRLGVWFFVDIGIDVIGAPLADGADGVGRAEPMVATPMRLGLLLRF